MRLSESVPKQYGQRRGLTICCWKINVFENKINLKYVTIDYITYQILADTVTMLLKGQAELSFGFVTIFKITATA